MSDGRLYLVRHGETASNAERLWQGKHGDDPLNERGRAQSLAAANALSDYSAASALYASDLRRAAETANVPLLLAALPGDATSPRSTAHAILPRPINPDLLIRSLDSLLGRGSPHILVLEEYVVHLIRPVSDTETFLEISCFACLAAGIPVRPPA